MKNIGCIFLVTFSYLLLTACSPDIEEASQSFQLTPTGEAVPLTVELRKIIKDPNESLSIERINIDEYASKSGKKNKSGSELFLSKSISNVKLIIKGLSAYHAENNNTDKVKALSIIDKHISDKEIFIRPAHQFLINNKLGNRVIFYGGDNELEHGPAHKNIDALSHQIKMPVIKVMTHFNHAQGGYISDILEDTSGGMTHVGGYSASWFNNKPTAVRSDWPADYGRLNDENRYYNAHLLAIDYQAGTKKEIPQNILKEYHKNYQTWDALTGMIIPYTRSSKIEEFQDYKNNPLEATNIEALKDLANVSATLDKSKINFTSYCAEGMWNVANLAVNVPITKKKYPEIDKFIKNYQSAPGFKDMDITQRRHHPEIGWLWLYKQGLISDSAYEGILQTNRNTIYLDWVADDLTPWTVYQPQRNDGLIANPMTLGTLVRMLIRTYYPRESVTKAVISSFNTLYENGDETVKSAIETVLDGFSPTNIIGERILFENAYRMANAELAYIVQSDMLKNIIFKKLGYEHIVNFEDQEKVDNLFIKYVASISDPEFAKRKDFDKKLASLDKELANMKIKMKVYGPNDVKTRTEEKVVPFFMWTPPQAWVFWAQHPNEFNSRSLRYVATAMHIEQSKDYKEK